MASTQAGMSTVELSAICDHSSTAIDERQKGKLLRPIFINAVEVGYGYSYSNQSSPSMMPEIDRRLKVRGLTIALFHFISAGHQVLALLPICFKSYPDKSTNHEELMALHRMNLVEFTPGYGAEKYTQVNRFAAIMAYECGGCIVARSQMLSLVDEKPLLLNVVENRLLMPTFLGDDIMFPIDGPLGRKGGLLVDTLSCDVTDEDYPKCYGLQMPLEDQRIWLRRISMLIPDKLCWSSLAARLGSWQPMSSHMLGAEPVPATLIPLVGVRPPDTNPTNGRGFSAKRRGRKDFYHCIVIERQQQKVHDDSVFVPDYACSDYYDQNAADRAVPNRMDNIPFGGHQPYGQPPQRKNNEMQLPNYLGRPGSIYRIYGEEDMSRRDQSSNPPRYHPGMGPPQTGGANRPPQRNNVRYDVAPIDSSVALAASPPRSSPSPPNGTHPCLTQLALVLGWQLAKRITDAHPQELDMNRLANLAFEDPAPPAVSPRSGAASASASGIRTATTPPSRQSSGTAMASTSIPGVVPIMTQSTASPGTPVIPLAQSLSGTQPLRASLSGTNNILPPAVSPSHDSRNPAISELPPPPAWMVRNVPPPSLNSTHHVTPVATFGAIPTTTSSAIPPTSTLPLAPSAIVPATQPPVSDLISFDDVGGSDSENRPGGEDQKDSNFRSSGPILAFDPFLGL